MSSISASVSSASTFQSQSASRKPKCKNCNKVGHDAASCWSSNAKAAAGAVGGARNNQNRARNPRKPRTKQMVQYKKATGGASNAANTSKRAPRPPANSGVQCFNCQGFGHMRRNCATRSSQAPPRKATTDTFKRNKPPPSKCTGCKRVGHTRAQCMRCWNCGQWQHTKRTCPKKS